MQRDLEQQLTRESSELLPFDSVSDSQLDLFELVKDIELGEIEAVVSVDSAGMPQDDQIEPSTAATSTSRGAILTSNFLEMDASLLKKV
jgi:hypothetical protein